MDRSPNKLNIKAFRKLITPYLIVDSLIMAGERFSQGLLLIWARQWWGEEEGLWISIVMRNHYIKWIEILHLMKLIDAALSDLMEHSSYPRAAPNTFPLAFTQHGEQLKFSLDHRFASYRCQVWRRGAGGMTESELLYLWNCSLCSFIKLTSVYLSVTNVKRLRPTRIHLYASGCQTIIKQHIEGKTAFSVTAHGSRLRMFSVSSEVWQEW